MASALMMRAAAGATALAAAPAPRVAVFVVPVPRPSRQVAARAAKLDKPNRLWVRAHSSIGQELWHCCLSCAGSCNTLPYLLQELDTVWYPGAEAAPHLDATLGECSLDASECGRVNAQMQVTTAKLSTLLFWYGSCGMFVALKVTYCSVILPCCLASAQRQQALT